MYKLQVDFHNYSYVSMNSTNFEFCSPVVFTIENFVYKRTHEVETCIAQSQLYFGGTWLLSKSLQAINAGEGVEKREPSYTVGGNAN